MNTLAVALGDSPAGLAAWIVEKLQAWSADGAFTVDELLTWVTAYWVSGTIDTSFATYAEAFLNIREYVEHEAGDHFAAWERPEAYAADMRRAIQVGS